jgi:hypothetical protein
MRKDYDSFIRDFYFDVINNDKIITPTLPQELYELYRMAYITCDWHKKPLIVELGTYNGFSIMAIALGVRDSRNTNTEIFTIDSYGSDGYKYDGLSFGEVGDIVKRRFPEVKLIFGDDIKFMMSLKDDSVNMLFIDSWHVRKHVYNTLVISEPKMFNKLSLMCGHDYSWTEWGVVNAVDEWCKGNPKVRAFVNNIYSIWTAVITDRKD